MNVRTVHRDSRRPDRRGAERQGATREIRFTVADSSLGSVLVARTRLGLCAVLLGQDRAALEHDLRERFPSDTIEASDAPLAALAAKIVALIESPGEDLDVPLDPGGTEFQRSVWRALREIPVGQTVTYTEIARRIGRPRSARAVAGACAANALAIAIPCHRVRGSDGNLTGYRWGLERKRALLENEARARAGGPRTAARILTRRCYAG